MAAVENLIKMRIKCQKKTYLKIICYSLGVYQLGALDSVLKLFVSSQTILLWEVVLLLFPAHRLWNLSSEKLRNMLRFTQLESDSDGMYTQVYLNPKAEFLITLLC